MCASAMDLLPKTLTASAGRLGAAAQNALEVARFGGLASDEEPSPYEVVSEQLVYRLRHYHPGSAKRPGPPVLLVPPLMLAAEVYDVSARTSAVTLLREHGVDPWVVDFGAPEREKGGLERTLADHVIAVSDAVDRVRRETGADVNLGGYSQGGMFCYQVAAYRRNDGLASLVTFGSPVDTTKAMPLGIPRDIGSGLATLLADTVFRGSVPAWVSRMGFRMLDPVKSMRSRIDFIMRLHDREALLPREGQRRFLEAEGWVAWPGPAMTDFLREFIAHNRMLEGGFVIDDRLLTLADIACPILSVVGNVDEIAPAAGVRAIRQAAPRAEVYELALDAGHFGLVVGSKAVHITWPAVAAWAKWTANGKGTLPAEITEVPDEEATPDLVPQVRNRVTYGLELAGAVGTGMMRSVLGTADRTARSVRELARETATQLPRLARLDQIQPSTRISLGLLLEERQRRAPDDVFFLFEDRAYAAREVNERIDNVVRGLIWIGVRQGEHVGVLMGPRPTALAVVAAISRLGAVAVLLRPDGDVALEARMGQVHRIIADPERAEVAAGVAEVRTFVLGGGGGPRDLGSALTDMEQIDPGAVALPRWHAPNPGRASDVAFILFTGTGDRLRASRITNRRWAMSAFGTASAAALGEADTVYSVTPLYHASALLMSIGGAIAGGARLALGGRYDPATFWEEIRRYGVSVATYTWTSLHDLVDAPPQPGERHHQVRLFIGSGMPRGLWRRVQRRFAPARVLEFYAATETGAILVNVSGSKIGAMGRPLPGSAEVRVAAYNPGLRELILRPDGYTRECAVDEVGMLLARSRRDVLSTSVQPLRGVFARDDAWIATGDLFRRDRDGDFWRMDHAAEVVNTAHGPAYTVPIRDALGDLPAIDLAVAYGVRPPRAAHDVAVAAVTLRADHDLHTRDIAGALAGCDPHARPSIVQVVEEIPVTTWYRPITAPLREAGIPQPDPDRQIWCLDEARGRYRPLTATARKRLLRAAA